MKYTVIFNPMEQNMGIAGITCTVQAKGEIDKKNGKKK